MFRCARLIGLAIAGISAWPVSAAQAAYDLIRSEQHCPRDKEPRSLRQTIIILDEAIVGSSGEGAQSWKRIVVEAADAKGDVTLNVLGTRERVTLLLARRDGSDLVPLFLACSPNISSDETAKSRGSDGYFATFIGTSTDDRLRKSRDAYVTGIARALAQVDKRAEAQRVAAPAGGLLRALRNAGQLVDLNQGIPRFIIVSPFTVVERSQPSSIPAARELGFQAAEQHTIDFGRAEVYLAGASLSDGPSLEFARAFVLGSKGTLAGTRSDGLPRLQPEPTTLRAYAGFIDYVDQRVPVQLRLSASAQGDLVNSWIETTRSRSIATPVGGKMLCRGEACEVRGDGRFAQVWFSDPQGEPADRAKLAFAGARNIEMTVQGRTVTGRVSDPKVIFGGSNSARREDLRFELQRVEDGQF